MASKIKDAKWRRDLIRHLEATYYPCPNGLHVCGFDDERGPFTICNHPVPMDQALELFEAAKASCSDPDDGDAVVDLMIDGGHWDDFWIRRQMFEQLAALAGRQALAQGTDHEAR